MEIRLLKTFVAVAQLKGFSSAARALNTVQPAVSRQVLDLEQELGVRLFWRSTREVRLTVAGETLLREAQELLAHEQRARMLVKKAGTGKTGRLRIGFISAASHAFLPRLVRRFGVDFPELQIRLTELTAAQQVEAFAAGQLDIGLSRPLPATAPGNWARTEVYVDRLLAYLPSEHVLAQKNTVSLTELTKYPLVLFDRSGAPRLFDQIISACKAAGVSPEIVQSNSMQSMLTEVAAGLGVSLAPGCVQQLNMAGCKSLPLQEDAGPIPLELHYQRDQVEPSTQAFVDLLMDERARIRQQFTQGG